MTTPRAIDQSRANPVHYREKDNSRANTPKRSQSRDQPEATTADEMPDSRRQEIVLNIPQQQRDDDDSRSDVISRAASSPQLEQVPSTDKIPPADTEQAVMTSPDTNSGGHDLRTNEAVDVADISGNSLEQTPVIDTSRDEFQKQEAHADTNNCTSPAPGTATNQSHDVTINSVTNNNNGENITEEDLLAARLDVTTADETIDDDTDGRTVPDMDTEIEAVMRAQQEVDSAMAGVFDLTQPHVDFDLARRNGEAMQWAGEAAAGGEGGTAGDAHSMSDVNGAVLRGKTCTPASLYTEVSEIKYLGDDRQ